MKTISAEPTSHAPATPSWPLPAPASDWASNEPIRAELYGLEALDARGRALAHACAHVSGDGREGPLLQRLTKNEEILVRAHRRISELAARNQPLGTDAEWLLDNFYIVEEVLR